MHFHQFPLIRLKYEGAPRCRLCGHRVACNGYIPKETRYRPPWMWPIELINRHRAKKAKWKSITGYVNPPIRKAIDPVWRELTKEQREIARHWLTQEHLDAIQDKLIP